MAASWTELVKTVILHDFGENAHKVVECLVASEGTASRDQIRSHTELADDVVKKTLSILIQQRILCYRRATPARPKANPTKGFAAPAPPMRWNYYLRTREVRFRILAPKYIIHLKSTFGAEGEVVAELFMQHGKLSAPQLMELYVQKLRLNGDENATTTDHIARTGKLKQVAAQMIGQTYLEEVQRVDANGAPIVKNKAGGSEQPNKRQRTGSAKSLWNDEDTVYQLRHRRLLFDLRNKEVVDFISGRINPSAGAVIGLVLKEYPHNFMMSPKPVSAGVMLSMCARDEHAPTLPKGLLESYIDEMTSENTNILIEHDDGFIVNIKGIFETLQTKHVQAVVGDRVEPLAGRIYSLLSIYKRLEEKQVAEFATAPLKDVRRVLHALYQHGFATMQEIPRLGNSDRNPTRQFYLWGVPTENVSKMLLDQFMRTWCKLRVRLKVENVKCKLIHDKIDTQEALSKEESVEYKKWKRGDDRLRHSTSYLDQLILIFKDFIPHQPMEDPAVPGLLDE